MLASISRWRTRSGAARRFATYAAALLVAGGPVAAARAQTTGQQGAATPPSGATAGAADTAAPPAFDTPPSAATGDAARAAIAERAASVAVNTGDRVRMRVWREPTLSDDFIVNDRGEVVLPLLGPVHVAGRTIAAVRDTLRVRYTEFLRNPSIDVIVFRRVAVEGEVRAPNLYYVDATKTVRDVLTEAGGPLETANRNRISVVRDGRIVATGKWDSGAPVGTELRSGDQVIVPRQSWWALNALQIVGALGVVVPVGLSLLSYLKR